MMWHPIVYPYYHYVVWSTRMEGSFEQSDGSTLDVTYSHVSYKGHTYDRVYVCPNVFYHNDSNGNRVYFIWTGTEYQITKSNTNSSARRKYGAISRKPAESPLFEAAEKILVLGLEGAGKSKLLLQLGFGDVVSTMPDGGDRFEVEAVTHPNGKSVVQAADLTGDANRDRRNSVALKNLYEQAWCLVFMIDSRDRERLSVAAETLRRILAEPELEKMPLLVLCNKQDLGAISLEKMSAELNLNSVIGASRSWRLCGCSVDLGDAGTLFIEGLTKKKEKIYAGEKWTITHDAKIRKEAMKNSDGTVQEIKRPAEKQKGCCGCC